LRLCSKIKINLPLLIGSLQFFCCFISSKSVVHIFSCCGPDFPVNRILILILTLFDASLLMILHGGVNTAVDEC
jgi:hypothetical protein